MADHRIRPELLARFGADPDALEWARWHVQQEIDVLSAAADLPQASPGFAHTVRFTATWLRDNLIGSPGCVGRFDARNAESASGGDPS